MIYESNLPKPKSGATIKFFQYINLEIKMLTFNRAIQ